MGGEILTRTVRWGQHGKNHRANGPSSVKGTADLKSPWYITPANYPATSGTSLFVWYPLTEWCFLKSDGTVNCDSLCLPHTSPLTWQLLLLLFKTTQSKHCLAFGNRATLLWHLICSGYLTWGWRFGRQSDFSVVGVHPSFPLSFMTLFKPTTHCHSVHNLHTCFISGMFQMVRESRRVAFL